MNKKSYATVGAVALLSVFALAGCKSQSASATSSKTLHTTATANPVTLDPTKNIDVPSASMDAQAFEGLYTLDKNNHVTAGVATKVVQPTNDGKTYTFTLRKNAKWSNGDPVVAADFVNAFQHWADPKSKSQSSDKVASLLNFKDVNSGKAPVSELGVKALGTHQLQLKLSKPVPYMKYLLAADYFPVNSRLLKQYGQKYGSTSSKTAYNGAYKVTGWTGVNDTWNYVKNPHYWNQKSVKLNKVSVQVAKDDNTSQNLFKNGTIQETSVSGNYAKENQHNKSLKTSLAATMYYLYFNSKKPLTSDQNFRKAMSYVVNRQTLAKNVLGDGSVAATGMVGKGDMTNPKTGKDFAAEAGNLMPTDTAKAKQYWAAAKKDLKKSSYTLNLLADNTDDQKQVAQYIQEVAQKNFSGLKVTIKTVPHAQHISADFAGNFEMNLTDWNSDEPDASDLLDLAQKGNKVNFTNFSDPTFDSLMEKAANQAADPSARYATLQKANKRLAETAGVVPLYQMATAHLVSDQLLGVNYSMFTSTTHYRYVSWK